MFSGGGRYQGLKPASHTTSTSAITNAPKTNDHHPPWVTKPPATSKKNKKKSHPQIPNAPCNVYGISTYIYHKLKLYINWSFKCNLGKWFQSHGAFIGKFQEIHGNPCSLVRFLLAWHQDVGSSVPAATSVVRVQAVWLVDWTTQLKKKTRQIGSIPRKVQGKNHKKIIERPPDLAVHL